MKELILLRGLPGSGKSTLAKSLSDYHVEADSYFIDNMTGLYKFSASELKEAHEWCRKSVEDYMKYERARIVVSNTFTEVWEMIPYYVLATQYDYKVFSLIVENRHNGMNEHGVPEDKIEQMKKRFQIKL